MPVSIADFLTLQVSTFLFVCLFFYFYQENLSARLTIDRSIDQLQVSAVLCVSAGEINKSAIIDGMAVQLVYTRESLARFIGLIGFRTAFVSSSSGDVGRDKCGGGCQKSRNSPGEMLRRKRRSGELDGRRGGGGEDTAVDRAMRGPGGAEPARSRKQEGRETRVRKRE